MEGLEKCSIARLERLKAAINSVLKRKRAEEAAHEARTRAAEIKAAWFERAAATGANERALHEAWHALPWEVRHEKYEPKLAHGERVPCAYDQCWYEGHLDRAGEWAYSYGMSVLEAWEDEDVFCDVCTENGRDEERVTETIREVFVPEFEEYLRTK
jgi:hypothetical protein